MSASWWTGWFTFNHIYGTPDSSYPLGFLADCGGGGGRRAFLQLPDLPNRVEKLQCAAFPILHWRAFICESQFFPLFPSLTSAKTILLRVSTFCIHQNVKNLWKLSSYFGNYPFEIPWMSLLIDYVTLVHGGFIRSVLLTSRRKSHCVHISNPLINWGVRL